MSRRNRPIDIFKHISIRGAEECWPCTLALNDKGLSYIQVGKRKLICYRVVFILVNDDLAEGEVVRHTCDNGADPNRTRGWNCCNPKHLVKGSHQENMEDMKGRDRHGANAHVVRNIRKLAAAGQTHAAIAELYGMARQTVTDIVNGVTHNHVND